MEVKFMTLEGLVDRDVFRDEWWASADHEATFLVANDILYLMPYGNWDEISAEQTTARFGGPYRTHHFVKRDFQIEGDAESGGYLRLENNRKRCSVSEILSDFAIKPAIGAIEDAVTSAILR
jgi:hypothetical protein